MGSSRTDLATFVAELFRRTHDVVAGQHPAVVAGEVEPVHKMRVATRQLRSDLRTFDQLLAPARVAGLAEELQQLARALGAVRDLDVLRPSVVALVETLPAAHRIGGEALVAILDGQRADAHGALGRLLETEHHRALVARLAGLATEPPLAPGRPSDSDADPHVRRAVRRSLKRVARRARKLGTHPDDAALHELRKQLKRTRYAAAALAELSGRTADKRTVRALGALQDELGAMQDLSTLDAWLGAVAATPRERAAFAAGVLCPAAAQRRSGARARWRATRAALRALSEAQR